MKSEKKREQTTHSATTRWNPRQYERAAGYVANEFGADLLHWFAPATETTLAGQRVLDLGCGDGDLSQRLRERRALVTGVDSSAEMVAAARARGIDAIVCDARDIGKPDRFAGRFDLVFTNAVLHWIWEKDRVVEGVRRVLKPGAAFIGEFGGADNVRLIQAAVREAYHDAGHPGELSFPWHFVSDTEFTRLLQEHGFRVRRIVMFERRPVLPEGIVGWLETFASTIAVNLSSTAKQALWCRAEEILRPRLYYGDAWHADYVRLRFEAQLDS